MTPELTSAGLGSCMCTLCDCASPSKMVEKRRRGGTMTWGEMKLEGWGKERERGEYEITKRKK